MQVLPERPTPARSLAENLRAWLQWIGISRLVTSTVAIVAVAAAGYWLVKPPAATTESKLPYAATSSVARSETSVAATAVTAAVPATVHVAGAVITPGVYQLPVGSRVVDAVRAAGGFASNANSDAVNLAAPIADGQRVYVPAAGETISSVVSEHDGVSVVVEQWPININSANADRLEDLPGVGPATASAIVAHRDLHGPFGSVDQLADVRGIGPAKLEAIRALVVV